ncbi:TROVE2 [Mytilus coruscus]|uniref:TROVE2 n=1 Tax=Mytilus coruscus TaxID=42192 RepID=A0A6J8B7J3_MYTCO|nr:TROVE2 [Mytilus coruscus]
MENFNHQIEKHTASINRLIQEGKGREVVDLIKQISIEGRAPKQGPLLYALALCARCDDKLTKIAAYRSLIEVCRLPTHLFQFIKYAEKLSGETSGWGRTQRKAVSHLYNQPSFQKNPMKLLRLGIITTSRKLSKLHLLDNESIDEAHVIGRLENVENLRFARIHPFTLLTAWNSYRRGHSGPRKSLIWTVNQKIANGLETAFYKSFASVDPIKKRILIAMNGSEAMMQPANGMKEVSARSTAVAMAFILSKIGDNTEVILVKEQLVPVNLDQSDNLEVASQKFSINGTSDYYDPCKPMNWARENKMKFDAIVFFTASLTFNNNDNPSATMRQYREELGIPRARLVNVGMASNEFTVTDHTDAKMLNVVGLDSNILTMISDFVRR